MRAVGVMIAVSLLIGVLTVGPIGAVFGPLHWLCGGVGFAISLPAAALTLGLTLWFTRTSPYGAVLGLAVGPVARAVAVLGLGGAIYLVARSDFEGVSERELGLTYWLWVLFAYLVTMVVETVLLVRSTKMGSVRA